MRFRNSDGHLLPPWTDKNTRQQMAGYDVFPGSDIVPHHKRAHWRRLDFANPTPPCPHAAIRAGFSIETQSPGRESDTSRSHSTDKDVRLDVEVLDYLQIGQTSSQPFQDDPELEPSEGCPQAKVRSKPEREVRILRSTDIESKRIRKDPLVPIGRGVEKDE